MEAITIAALDEARRAVLEVINDREKKQLGSRDHGFMQMRAVARELRASLAAGALRSEFDAKDYLARRLKAAGSEAEEQKAEMRQHIQDYAGDGDERHQNAENQRSQRARAALDRQQMETEWVIMTFARELGIGDRELREAAKNLPEELPVRGRCG